MIKKNSLSRKLTQKKVICLTLSSAMVLGLVGCGQEEAAQETVVTDEEQEQVLNGVLNAQVNSLRTCGCIRERRPGDRQRLAEKQ